MLASEICIDSLEAFADVSKLMIVSHVPSELRRKIAARVFAPEGVPTRPPIEQSRWSPPVIVRAISRPRRS